MFSYFSFGQSHCKILWSALFQGIDGSPWFVACRYPYKKAKYWDYLFWLGAISKKLWYKLENVWFGFDRNGHDLLFITICKIFVLKLWSKVMMIIQMAGLFDQQYMK